ncbi:tripartite tricarboxylate transporter substrate binding protein [Comamonas piscis]|uniref:Tripartite tricarboxylate transporter substrate binding protein n=1 Tax=Comamonas piscis TaxID=1562974 RepID=A0A7G5EEU5_9BURK|nr:tripartite tricarboxylate transporter substrate binding protein [Comamonas piscis]QMV72520.1 tripartite tricarboxylate transporter substrate binding protein [Comamonas piscis]WSO35289.1 tripartite tricarboxylate transporter substrate binding protein [Comamonas piscis]
MAAAKFSRRWLMAAAGLLACTAHAAYPDKPIKIIVPSVAGSSPDVLVRLVGNALSLQLGKPVVIENKGGAGGNIGMQALASSAPDGYTLGYGNNATLTTNEFLFSKLPYDPRSLLPVGGIATTSSFLLVHPEVPVNSVEELVTYIRSSDAAMHYGSGGIGTTSHLGAELFKTKMGLRSAVHVPYKGSPQALNDLVGGSLQFYFENIVTAAPQLQASKLRALAVTSAKRSPQYPHIPTMQEAGVQGFVMNAWGGLLVPPGTPRDVVERLNTALNQVLQSPDIKAQLEKMAYIPLAGMPEDFKALADAERAHWGAVVKASGARVE